MTHTVCPGNPVRWLLTAACGLAVAAAQIPGGSTLDWRRMGNAAVLRPGGDLATGAVRRAWFAGDGLAIQTSSGAVWRTADFETWSPASLFPLSRVVETAGLIRYRLAEDLLRSEDGGRTWINCTGSRRGSILPGPLEDFAVHPTNSEEVVAVGAGGVWRSLDAGKTWAGINAELPALSVERILETPNGVRPLRIAAGEEVLDWHPGQRLGWTRSTAWAPPGVESAAGGDYLYLGTSDGQILVRRGDDPRPPFRASGAVTRFWLDPRDPARAVAVAGGKLWRTFNGGAYWDDVTGSLEGTAVTAVVADSDAGAIYAGRADGLYLARWDVSTPGPAPAWVRIPSPAAGLVRDLRLDPESHQLFVAIEGWGVYSAIAPHRRQNPAVVSAADLVARAAAPGALLSVLGPSLTAARSGSRAVPVLSSAAGESQLQLPFDLSGGTLDLRLEGDSGPWNFSLPLRGVSPAIVVDRDGSPLILDADSGVLLDALHPLRAGMRVQILATGLGRVRPEWPLATPAPADNPPAVEARIAVMLDRQALRVTRATLAPGYIGFYLVEAEVPALVNAGTVALAVLAGGSTSNAVRVYIEP